MPKTSDWRINNQRTKIELTKPVVIDTLLLSIQATNAALEPNLLALQII